jgi:LCP family protein required for cell wall assembly
VAEAGSHRLGTAGRAGLAGIASSVLPGWGQWLTGRQTSALVLLAVDILAVGFAVAVAFVSPASYLEAWVTPTVLTTLAAGNFVVLVYRGAAALGAWVAGRSRTILDFVGLAVAIVLVAVPHVAVAGLVASQQDLLDSVFVVPTTTTTTTPAPTTSSIPSVQTTTSESATTTTTTQPPRAWDGFERVNVLLLGSDAGIGRTGTRTDTMILASVDPRSGDMAMFSIPRNLTEAPLPEGMGVWSCNCFPDILTHLWANGEWYPDAFPGPQSPSVNALKAAVGLTFDLDVHYYAKVDLEGFVGIVDALGGVTIDVPKAIVDPEYPHEGGGTEYVAFEVGEQHLDGHRALAYARIRRGSGDFARMHRQRCVLGALADQVGVFDILRGYDDFVEAVKSHVETDVPIDKLDDFVDILSRIDTDRFGTLRITAYNYGTSGHPGYQLYDLEAIRADARALMADPSVRLETQDGAGLEATCDESFD